MNNVENIFQELKSKNLINEKIRLIPNKFTPDFKAGLRNKAVYYNPSYSTIRPNGIRFLLLHEIGHMQKFSAAIPSIIACAGFALLSYFVIPYFFGTVSHFRTLISILFFWVTFKLFTPHLRKEELNADSWATMQILRAYKNIKPSTMIEQAREDILNIKQASNIFFRSIYRIFGYHPEYGSRLQNVLRIEKAFRKESKF